MKTQKSSTKSKEKQGKDVAQQILTATEMLIAKEGLQNLSMRKIATEAGIALGSVYLHFKTKDELLDYLAFDLYKRFETHICQNYDPNLSLFERYRQLWWNKWKFLTEYPTVAQNLSQYQALMGFNKIFVDIMNDPNFVWNQLVAEGQQQGVIAKLPTEVLFVLGFDVLSNLAFFRQLLDTEYSEEVLEKTLERAWKAITI